ncbi:MAG: hypothetical protein SFY67_06550 [Candidatus Melainabacteria bacterium]|nr:hypothetical protein [Candidatus Melainabacteria bacterium]
MSELLSKQDFALEAVQALLKSGIEQSNIYLDLLSFTIQIKGDRGEVLTSMTLSPFYRLYESKPENKDKLLTEIVETRKAVDLPATFEEAKPQLRPVVRIKWFYPKDDFPQIEIGEHLCVLLGIDTPTNILYCDNYILNRWDCKFEEAIDYAIEELGKNTEFEFDTSRSNLDKDDVCHFFTIGDDYAASRVVFSGILESLPVKGDTLVVVPSKGYVMVTGTMGEFGLSHTINAVAELHEKPDALAPHFMLLKDGAYYPFEFDAEHQFFKDTSILENEFMEQLYYAQKEQLSSSFESIIGKHKLLDYVSNKKEYSLCVVEPDDIPASIPAASVIVFTHNEEMLAAAPLFHVLNVMGDSVKALNLYPERFELNRFPNAEELDQISRVEEFYSEEQSES